MGERARQRETSKAKVKQRKKNTPTITKKDEKHEKRPRLILVKMVSDQISYSYSTEESAHTRPVVSVRRPEGDGVEEKERRQGGRKRKRGEGVESGGK